MLSLDRIYVDYHSHTKDREKHDFAPNFDDIASKYSRLIFSESASSV